jgi:3-oxoacyl-[acyl-carrier protein] reductase
VDNAEEPAVLITGASNGIGVATARAFADAGYGVIVTDILREAGRSVADSIRSAGGEAEYHHLDVRNSDEVKSAGSARPAACGRSEGQYRPSGSPCRVDGR